MSYGKDCKAEQDSNPQWKPDPEPRRRGFREYDPSCGSHYDKNPYNFGTWQFRSFANGWSDAHVKEEKEEKDAAIAKEADRELFRRERAVWESISFGCPWQAVEGVCDANDQPCSESNCAVMHILNMKG